MQNIDQIIMNEVPQHPFESIPGEANYKIILANYLAMSQAFPYLQAGSQKDLIFHYMDNNQDLSEDVELTSVVGNFLCWDETGGLHVTLARGMKGISRILETRRFHANLLKKDCSMIFGESLAPDYSVVTKTYLTKLFEGLSSLCSITRVAYMVSFENHANRMIQALWDSISQKFDLDKKRLSYFLTHVGGDDPAEAYHVAMTHELISKIVPVEKADVYHAQFMQAYKLHINWCADIVALGANYNKEVA